MFDIVTAMNLTCFGVEAKATAEGRQATSEEYQAAMQKTWDGWLGASVDRDMAVAGFVKTDAGWTKPRRGLFARLFG